MTRARKPVQPILDRDAPPHMRQRLRADGSWRVWWEPRAADIARGFRPVELDPSRPAWSIRRARDLNAELARVEAATGTARRTGRTISDLIENYRRCPHFTDLAPKTRESYSRLLLLIERKWGAQLVSAFTKPIMNEWYEAILRTGKTRMAQAMIRQMSILFSRAETIGWRPEGSNPCFRMKMRTPDRRQRRIGWRELDALVRAADDLGLHSIGTACLMLTLQGQRSTDVRNATLAQFHLSPASDNSKPRWIWVLTRQKRGTRGAMPLHHEVEARLRPLLLRTVGAPDAAIITTPGGAPYSEGLMIDHFNRARDHAATRCKALTAIQMRDLRRSFGILARAGGASIEDVGDVLGNTAARDPELKETYMPGTLETTTRAVDAVRRPTARKEA